MRWHDVVFLDHHRTRKFGFLCFVEDFAQRSLVWNGEHDLRAAVCEICRRCVGRGCKEGIEEGMAGLGCGFA